MAMKFNFVSPDHGVTYTDAYGRILGGEFGADFYHVYVGVYANEAGREKEKAVELLHKQIIGAQEEILIRKQAVDKANEAVAIANDALAGAKDKLDAGKIKQPTYDKALADSQTAMDALSAACEAHTRAYMIDEQIRAGLSNEAPTKLLATYKYTFNTEDIKIDENGLYTALYHKLQDVEPFVGSFKN